MKPAFLATPTSTTAAAAMQDSLAQDQHIQSVSANAAPLASPGGQCLQELRNAARCSQTRTYMNSACGLHANSMVLSEPFFTHLATYTIESDSGDDSASSGDDGDEVPVARNDRKSSTTAHDGPKGKSQHLSIAYIVLICVVASAWFKQPRTMSDWLYTYFREVIHPMINQKSGSNFVRPAAYGDGGVHAPPSFWVHPPDTTFSLACHRLNMTSMYLPRIFFWLPHFLVTVLCCPCCGKPLEKNGALPPRRITDMDHSFYIVTWDYFCRSGCKTSFRGWSQRLLDSLPAYVRLSFPAILSRKGGLSNNVISQLRVGNQHKMGPQGVHSLLLEMHTLRFNKLQTQYLEAIFELYQGRTFDTSQSTIHSYFDRKFPSFGNFGDIDGYSGFVPSERYLASMMNKVIERDEADANQHTACLAIDQLAIDDSHKVCPFHLQIQQNTS